MSAYHLSIDDIRAGFMPNGYSTSLADSYFGVIVAYYPESGNPQFSIITSPYKWSDNVPSSNPYDMPAGYDLRWTLKLKNHMFYYKDKDFYVFPILSSKVFSNNDTLGVGNTSQLQEGNATINLLSEWIVPMPLDPLQVHTTTLEKYAEYYITAASATAGTNTINFTCKVKNISDLTVNLEPKVLWFEVLIMDSNRNMLWQATNLYLKDYGTVTGGDIAVGAEITVNASISHTLDRGSGYFISGDIIYVNLQINTTSEVATNDRITLGTPATKEIVIS